MMKYQQLSSEEKYIINPLYRPPKAVVRTMALPLPYTSTHGASYWVIPITSKRGKPGVDLSEYRTYVWVPKYRYQILAAPVAKRALQDETDLLWLY
jgi:hypothetical protein